MTDAVTGLFVRALQRFKGFLLCLGLVCTTGGAMAGPFVSYDFSSTDGGLPIAGTVTFSSGMPVVDNCCSWLSYQPSAVVTLTAGPVTWSNAATPNGYCDVWFHVGWIQVTFWCRLTEPVPELGDTAFRLDFVSTGFDNWGYDSDPIGPFTPETLHQHPVWGTLFPLPFPGSDPWGRALALDAVRITPYVSEPGMPMLLVAGTVAGFFARRSRRRR